VLDAAEDAYPVQAVEAVIHELGAALGATAVTFLYRLRAPVQGSCPYSNICEHCPSFHTTSDYIPVLTQQREDAPALAADATSRGWDSETERNLKLSNRINDLITAADARGQAM